MNKEEGLKQIDQAIWKIDKHGCLNLNVTDLEGRNVHCFITMRPSYCDRGHMQLNIDGCLNLDYADSFPRFFFSFKEADEHTRLFLKWRLWKHRVYDHDFSNTKY